MLRRLAKSGIAWGLGATGTERLVAGLSRSGHSPLVLGYHRVVESFAASASDSLPGLIISRTMLERQLEWLAGRFRFLSLAELGRQLEAGDDFRQPVAALTFDDGYADFHEQAYPLLRRKGIPAAVFVVTDVVARGALQLYDRLYILLSRLFSRSASAGQDVARIVRQIGFGLAAPRTAVAALADLLDALPQSALLRVADALDSEPRVDASSFPALRPLTWDAIRAMHRDGLVAIGSHTRSHALLTREDPSRVQEEATGSRRALEQALGAPIEHFAYPDGRFDEVSVAAVAAAGYRFAYTTCSHRDPRQPLLTVPRRMLWETSCLGILGRFSGPLMSCQATGVFDRLARCTHPPVGSVASCLARVR
jgi:peptidoglycan/xylan/chitin deacetylase (PgdA/CDA1 family)